MKRDEADTVSGVSDAVTVSVRACEVGLPVSY